MEDSYIALWWKSVLTSSLLRLYTYLILIKEFNNTHTHDFPFISSHFFSLGFYWFVGAQEFWVMGLTLILYLKDDGADLNIGTLLVPWFKRWRYIAYSC